MKQKKTKHQFRSNTLPALVTVGPVTVLVVLLIAVPLIYVAVMSFCSIDQFYNVTFQFTVQNYIRLANADYLRIYAQSLGIAFITTVICILIGYPFFLHHSAYKEQKEKNIIYACDHSLLDQFTDPDLRLAESAGNQRMDQQPADKTSFGQ